MDTSILLNAKPSAAAQHLQASAARLGIKEVTVNLLSMVKNESLPPRVFSLWLAAGGDCEAVYQGLHFQHSQAVRRASIARFGRLFRSSRYNDVWQAMGRVAGIMDYLAIASVCDVRNFCNQIRRSATAETYAESRVTFVDELCESLRHIGAHASASGGPDLRPLSSIYHSIFPACSQHLMLSAVDGKSGLRDAKNGKAAFLARTAVFRSRCISDIQDASIEVDTQRIYALLEVGSNDSGSLQDPGVSGNSQFALQVLEALSTRKELGGDAKDVLSRIATPLFRRLARRKCLPNTIIRATLAYVAFTQNHISNRMSLQELCYGPGASIVESWGRFPDRLEDSLVILLRLAPSQHLPRASEWLTFVRLVPKLLRFRLLKAVSRYDLTTDYGLEQSRILWDSHFLLALPKLEARQIFERLVKTGSASLNEYYFADRRQAEINLLQIKLNTGEPGLLRLATAAVEEQKNEANRAREQAPRGVCVTYTLQLAAVSQCLELYRDVLLWTRKYIKDPLTAMEIFRGPSFTSHECLVLLCGFPGSQDGYGALTLGQVASHVKQANVIITECVQMACQAQLEPGFRASHWSGVLGLMGFVVCRRYTHANVLQDALRLSDDDVFEAVWHDTLETCIALESMGLDNDNTGVEFNELGGPLMRNGVGLPKLIDPRPATFRFLDTLAKMRNELWEEYRRKQVPATMTLPEPYPRGLPLECLVPVDIEELDVELKLPYLLSRAKQVVFVPANTALKPLPVSDDEIDAIGSCVENWRNGLKIYVFLSGHRQKAALMAWEHAIGPLSVSRMSVLEAHLFWASIFSDSLRYSDVSGPWKETLSQPRPPQLPDVESGEQPTEWSPETDVKSFEIKSRRLEPTRVDAMLHTYIIMTRTMNTGAWPEPTPEIPSRSLDSFWNRWKQPWAASPVTREALVAAAILHVSEANSLSPAVLAKPFPSSGLSRFPALYLDGDFLDREDPKRCNVFVWDTLMQLSSDAPATLLVQLSESLIRASAASNDRTRLHALRLLRVLSKGDNPGVGLDLVQNLIMERPDDSSWQRLILNEGLLNSLPKPVVEKFLYSLVAAMQERLFEHANHKDNTAAPTTPRVKITTVKMISQLLSGATFVDNSFAGSTLIGLLANSTHIDIRVSVVESLLDILTTIQDAELCNDIMTAFEIHVVPIMSV